MNISVNGARILYRIEEVPLLGTVNITQTVVVSWLVLGILSGLALWMGSGLRLTGISRKQAVAELAVTSLVKFVRGNMGAEFDRYIPLVGTIFLTSLASNLISVLGIWSPTADLMTEMGWSLVVFGLITWHKIKAAGAGGYLKGFLRPLFVMAPVNILSELFTPISMACRHFGNILSGMVISGLIYGALTALSYRFLDALGSSWGGILLIVGGFAVIRWRKSRIGRIVSWAALILGGLAMLTRLGGGFSRIPWLAVGIPAVTGLYFDWFGGCIQAFIFCTLTTIFIKQAAAN